MTDNQDTWPAGATWVFQGTVAEDATGGTHVCTLTVTAGVGSEFEFLAGRIVDGNTATAQVVSAHIDDGTNNLDDLILAVSDTAQTFRSFPTLDAISANTSTKHNSPTVSYVSGGMRLILQVQTTALSVTQTFSVVCRIKGAVPTATLADSVGAPVLTTNTNKVF